MITFRYYDKEKRVDYVWYNSSSVLYSECDDKVDDFKELKVVFKGGSTYVYKKVNVHDYLMFMAGGLDGSNGKALNKFIKPNCEYERLPDTDLAQLDEKLLELTQRKKEESASEEETKEIENEN